MSKHNMITRSKNKYKSDPIIDSSSSEDELDEDGNLKDFIVNDLKQNSKKKKKKRNAVQKSGLNDLFVSYLILNATRNANAQLRKNKRRKIINFDNSSINETLSLEPRKKLTMKDIDNFVSNEDGDTDSTENYSDFYELDEVDDFNESDESNESDEDYDENDFDEDNISDDNISEDNISVISYNSDIESDSSYESLDLTSDSKITAQEDETEEEDSDNETLFEYDDLDQKFENLVDKNTSSEDFDIEYFHYLPKNTKIDLLEQTNKIYEIGNNEIPLRFKIIQSNMDIKTKSIAISNIDKLSEMDVSTGEYSKMDHWINGLIKIPFGKFSKLPVDNTSTTEDVRDFITNTYNILNSAIYGHIDAKTHILQVIGKWIRNPNSGGNVLAIQGPMGNGKTTLVKDGISKALNRPFAFIALGGASDSSYFDGHCYTYEGSNWGRIVQILQDSKCMNPVFYFDELDKISDTQKGDEIIHLLTHLTDSSQNSLFQDNYFPGIYIDLSKALFIFSYNDESKINKILKDRMYTIHTKGFNTKDKLKITHDFLLPNILKTYNFTNNEIIFNDTIITEIIEKYTNKEEGVRNLNRCIETIISKINIYYLTHNKVELSFKIDNFNIPFNVLSEHLNILLKITDTDKPPQNMYL